MNIKFYVNEDKRTTVCVIQTKNGVFRGRSKCNPEDMFSELKGKTLAEARARQKMMVKTRKALYKEYDELLDQMYRLTMRIEMLSSDIVDNVQFIDVLQGPKERKDPTIAVTTSTGWAKGR